MLAWFYAVIVFLTMSIMGVAEDVDPRRTPAQQQGVEHRGRQGYEPKPVNPFAEPLKLEPPLTY